MIPYVKGAQFMNPDKKYAKRLRGWPVERRGGVPFRRAKDRGAIRRAGFGLAMSGGIRQIV